MREDARRRRRTGRPAARRRQPQQHASRVAPGAIVSDVVRGGLRAALRRVDRVASRRATTASLMPSLTYGVAFGDAAQPLGVGLVLGEQQLGRALRRPASRSPSVGMARPRSTPRSPTCAQASGAAAASSAPRPGVAEPERRQQVRAAPASGPRLVTRDADEDVVRVGLGVLDHDVEVAVVGEDAGVDAARTRARRGRGGGSPRPARRTGRRAAGTCRAPACRSGSGVLSR